MGEMIKLTASDGHTFDAYRADPAETPIHIREVADSYAADGYLAIAPAIFDRQKTGVELGYEGDDVSAGRDLKDSASYEDAVKDLEATVAELKIAGKIGSVGYCWGGTLSYLCGARIDDVVASVVYYGGQIIPFKDEIINGAILVNAMRAFPSTMWKRSRRRIPNRMSIFIWLTMDSIVITADRTTR